MLKEVVTYEDLNGMERKDVLYFNLSKREVNEFGLDGFKDKIDKIQQSVETQSYNVNELIDLYMDLILKAYGKKSDDGTRFIKTPQMTEAFSQSCAFEALTDKLLQDENFANNFVLAILPKNMSQAAAEEVKKKKAELLGQENAAD